MRLSKRWIAGLAVLGITTSLILYFFRGWNTCLWGERDTYFRLPSSTQHIEEQNQMRGSSCVLWIKFEIPSNELENFLSTTFIQTPLVARASRESIADLQEQTGWDLGTATSYLSNSADGTGNQHLDWQQIFVDTRNPALYVVYLTTTKNWL